MNERIIQISGIAVTGAYFLFVVFLYAAQPRSLDEVSRKAATTIQSAATRGQVIIGTYEIDRERFDEGLAAFRREDYVLARDQFEKADPEKRDARTQFYIAYSFYRQGWGRVSNDDELFGRAIEAANRASALEPNFRSTDENLKLRTPAELRNELEEGLKVTPNDFNPLKIFREKK